MTKIRRVVRIEAKPGLAEQMRKALLTLQRATADEAGCEEFGFFQALDRAHSFLLIEDFADKAALDLHMQTPHTQAFFAQDLVAGIAPIEKAWMS